MTLEPENGNSLKGKMTKLNKFVNHQNVLAQRRNILFILVR
jgi:hypothetical protein